MYGDECSNCDRLRDENSRLERELDDAKRSLQRCADKARDIGYTASDIEREAR